MPHHLLKVLLVCLKIQTQGCLGRWIISMCQCSRLASFPIILSIFLCDLHVHVVRCLMASGNLGVIKQISTLVMFKPRNTPENLELKKEWEIETLAWWHLSRLETRLNIMPPSEHNLSTYYIICTLSKNVDDGWHFILVVNYGYVCSICNSR